MILLTCLFWSGLSWLTDNDSFDLVAQEWFVMTDWQWFFWPVCSGEVFHDWLIMILLTCLFRSGLAWLTDNDSCDLFVQEWFGMTDWQRFFWPVCSEWFVMTDRQWFFRPVCSGVVCHDWLIMILLTCLFWIGLSWLTDNASFDLFVQEWFVMTDWQWFFWPVCSGVVCHDWLTMILLTCLLKSGLEWLTDNDSFDLFVLVWFVMTDWQWFFWPGGSGVVCHDWLTMILLTCLFRRGFSWLIDNDSFDLFVQEWFGMTNWQWFLWLVCSGVVWHDWLTKILLTCLFRSGLSWLTDNDSFDLFVLEWFVMTDW